jgi:AcrR family transcriptional regulator
MIDMNISPPYRGDVTTPRPYRQRERAAATAGTRARILDAVLAAAHEMLTIEIRLDDIARRAGTTVQTVLRHFGSREALLDAAISAGAAAVAHERAVAPGDLDTALRVLLDHYEARGDFMARMVAQESSDARILAFTDAGRRYHRAWVADVWGVETPDLIDLLVVATDLATWRVLRREMGHDRATTERRMRALADAITATDPRSTP